MAYSREGFKPPQEAVVPARTLMEADIVRSCLGGFCHSCPLRPLTEAPTLPQQCSNSVVVIAEQVTSRTAYGSREPYITKGEICPKVHVPLAGGGYVLRGDLPSTQS